MRPRFFVLACVIACDAYSSGPGVLGVLTFEPQNGTAIAVGAQFVVLTNRPTHLVSADTSLAGAPASPRWQTDDSSALFEAEAEGTVSILAEPPDGGAEALDYLNLQLRKADTLSLSFLSPPDASPFAVSSSTITAEMRRDGTFLDGDYGCTWTMSEPNKATLTSGGDGLALLFWTTGEKNTVRVDALAPGSITITATCLGLTQSIATTLDVDGGTEDAGDAGDAAATDASADDASDANDEQD